MHSEKARAYTSQQAWVPDRTSERSHDLGAPEPNCMTIAQVGLLALAHTNNVCRERSRHEVRGCHELHFSRHERRVLVPITLRQKEGNLCLERQNADKKTDASYY
jgi:hypothetical protein